MENRLSHILRHAVKVFVRYYNASTFTSNTVLKQTKRRDRSLLLRETEQVHSVISSFRMCRSCFSVNCCRSTDDWLMSLFTDSTVVDRLLILYYTFQFLFPCFKTNKQTNNVETGSGRTGLYAQKIKIMHADVQRRPFVQFL